MYLLRLFLTAWLALGIVTVFFLFWLCKRTAAVVKESDQPDVQVASLSDSPVPGSRDRRTPRSYQFFRRVATAVAMAAVSAFMLVASSHRVSPLPAGLVVVQQEVPFRRVQPPCGGVAATKTIVMEPQTMKTERSVVADKLSGSATPGSLKKIVDLKRHSLYESEADMVAPDTVVHYRRRAVPR